ncbi:uncharacterized protein LOC135217185 [Macrobrachium nipponense]|uniref:uncharacterized protein LOC135217185 n=1 Tax=Macrobrachium nipponense TaxID=159736 RepID=UPI0030C7D016
MLYVDKCCCGCSLRTGTIIVAIVDLLFDLLHPIAVIGHYIVAKDVAEDDSWITVFFVGELIIGLVDLVFCVLLIVGIRKESVTLIMTWWWWSVMQMALQVVYGIFFMFYHVTNGVSIVVFFMIAALLFYGVVVVKSYVTSIEKRRKVADELLLSESAQSAEL